MGLFFKKKKKSEILIERRDALISTWNNFVSKINLVMDLLNIKVNIYNTKSVGIREPKVFI